VALLSDSNAEPIKIVPYSAASLPEADQQLLEKGIPINNSRELTSLLEDYFS
jgi:hypothetical protein